MALRTLVLTLALALVATVGFAAGEEEAPATAMEKEMVTDPTTGEMVTAPAYGGTITYPLNDEPPNADIYLAGIHAGSAIDGVLEKLGVADWGTDRSEWDFAGLETPLSYMTGQLAESWSQPDDTTIIVKIRRGVRWHDKPPMNGRELTAKDLEYNYHRAMGLGSGFTELPGTYSSPLTNARLIFESITATDDATVVFKLKEPFLGGLRTILDDFVNWIYPPPRGNQRTRGRHGLEEPGRHRALHAHRLDPGQLDDLGQEPRLLGVRRKVPAEPPALC